MSNLLRRIAHIEQTMPQTPTDEERAVGWLRLIRQGNQRAIELYQIACQRRDADRGAVNNQKQFGEQ